MIEHKHSVIGIFSNRIDAEAAVHDLGHAGFHPDDIGLASPGEPLHEANTPTRRVEEKAARGAVAGAVTGGALGALAGAIAVGTIPAFGPVLAGGMLMGILGGAGTGAALGTFAGPFLAMGMSEKEAQQVETEFRSGRTIVVVLAEKRQDEAFNLLRRHDPIDVKVSAHRLSFPKA